MAAPRRFNLCVIARVCGSAAVSLAAPCVITNLANNWPAATKWKIDQLVKHYGDRDYLKSDRNNYLFDSSFDCDASEMNDDYTVPSLFTDLLDFLPRELIGEIDRRWLIIGRERFQGGSNCHQDPLGDAWNTLLEGKKKWIIIEPDEHDYNTGYSKLSPTINFCNFGVNKLFYDNAKHPGDTVYIPYKYHHMVLNLATSVAITHNFVSMRADRIISFLEDVKPVMSNDKHQKLENYVRKNMNRLINNANL